jgi:hypothetical protein
MKQSFDYYGDIIYGRTLDVEDTGNACLKAIDDSGCEYYLVMMTSLGQTSCLEWGPIDPQASVLPDVVNVKFQRIDYSEYGVAKIIRTFLQPRKSGKTRVDITDVKQMTPADALEQGVDLFDYMKNFGPTENY